ncbi:MAG TPA: type IV pilus modification protein PilV [Steroidobacteraceae bacterium]|nr:type IV pilus modification protein PilV [Steroidobacteraceae bacterium]
MTALKKSFAHRSRGFTLIEALVALVVLSIGLLGVAALQLTSLRSNHGSAMRSQATFLAYDIIDRMRANRTAALAGNYNIALGVAGVAGTVAGNDLVAWKQNIARTLPAVDNAGTPEPADGSVRQDGDIFTVTIRWSDWDDSGATARTPLEFTMDTQLLN